MGRIRVDTCAGSYRGVTQSNSYENDRGLVVVPLATEAPEHRVVKLHGGVAYRRVRWSASKSGVPPIIPAAENTPNDTLLFDTVEPYMPVPNPSTGSYDWNVGGEYVYVQNTPRVAGQHSFPAGDSPYIPHEQATWAHKVIESVAPGLFNDSGQTPSGWVDAVGELAPIVDSRNSPVTVQWPFTILPPYYSSSHIIGG